MNSRKAGARCGRRRRAPLRRSSHKSKNTVDDDKSCITRKKEYKATQAQTLVQKGFRFRGFNGLGSGGKLQALKFGAQHSKPSSQAKKPKSGLGFSSIP